MLFLSFFFCLLFAAPSAYMPNHIGSIVCGEGRLGPAHPVRADVISCNGGRAAVLSSISTKAAVAGAMGGG